MFKCSYNASPKFEDTEYVSRRDKMLLYSVSKDTQNVLMYINLLPASYTPLDQGNVTPAI